MSTRAVVEWDRGLRGVRLAVARDRSHIAWGPTSIVAHSEDGQAGDDAWLTLDEDDARAIYEALADWFGHAGHDTRALRKDYDAERGRVDRLINNLIGNTR